MKKFLVIILIILATAGGWYLSRALQHNKEEGPGHAPGQGTQQQAQPVDVLTLKTQTIPVQRSLPGRISAFRQAQIRPQVNGIITQRLFEEGGTVQKGQQLYQIDDAPYRAALSSAQADLKSAEASVTAVKAKAGRYAELVKINAVSRQDNDDVQAQLNQARAAVAVAQAAVDAAKVNFDYTKVYAPISGRISRSLVTEGALVTANQQQPLAVITQLDPVYADLQESGITAVSFHNRTGADQIPVTLYLTDKEGASTVPYPRQGQLKFSEVMIDPQTGSVTLRALVPNPDAALLPGLFVRAALDLGTQEVILVPQRATTRTPEGTLSVWVVDSSHKATPRVIKADTTYQDNWIVTGGATAGDTIVVEGYQKLRPGADVQTSLWKKEDPTKEGQE